MRKRPVGRSNQFPRPALLRIADKAGFIFALSGTIDSARKKTIERVKSATQLLCLAREVDGP